MPPSIGILVRQLELIESDYWVFGRLVSKWSAFEVAIFNVNVVVILWIADTWDHWENDNILIVDAWVVDFEPEFDAILRGPFFEGWCREAYIAILGI